MKRKNIFTSNRRTLSLIWVLIIGTLLGAILFAGGAVVLHKTNDTAFCVSCHTMQQPLAEYQGSIHFQNTKGIRAECADCHVPHEPLDYLVAKITALKDVYGEITGKIETTEKFNAHKLAMAESVWKKLEATDSATCRSCHNFDAMDIISQSQEARLQHTSASKSGETCISCHKGVAHILPDMTELTAAGASELAAAAAQTSSSATKLYTISTEPFYLQSSEQHTAGNLMPSTEVNVVKREGDRLFVEVTGWQQDGVTEVLYAAQGKRILTVLLGEESRKNVKIQNSLTDADTGLIWHQASLQVWLAKNQLIDDQEKIWQYASNMMSTNCTGCHGLTELNRFNANQWIGVVKGMAPRTSLNEEQLRILTQYVQKHASDMPTKQLAKN